MKVPSLLILLGATTISLATAEPLVVIDTVLVGDPGNAAASESNVTYDAEENSAALGYGAVADSFRIGVTEVTIAQYKAFLDAVATVPAGDYIEDLWNASMASDGNIAGIDRSGSGTIADPYVYTIVPGSENYPITYVSWFSAARFVNWLHNGAEAGSDTERGAYMLDGATSGTAVRNSTATWWLPSEDEWYKAAYYSPELNGGAGGYTLQANQSNTITSNVPGTSGGANFRMNGLFATTQNSIKLPAQSYLTNVGTYPGSSYYGTFDQNGNVWEWTDTVVTGVQYRIRNGSWVDQDQTLVGAAGSLNAPSTLVLFDIGFRVAGAVAPTPDTTKPDITISGKNRTTSKSSITISGKATDNIAVVRVEVKVGGKSYKVANGTDRWKFRAKLAVGKNKIRARAIDATGNVSKPAKIVIQREK